MSNPFALLDEEEGSVDPQLLAAKAPVAAAAVEPKAPVKKQEAVKPAAPSPEGGARPASGRGRGRGEGGEGRGRGEGRGYGGEGRGDFRGGRGGRGGRGEGRGYGGEGRGYGRGGEQAGENGAVEANGQFTDGTNRVRSFDGHNHGHGGRGGRGGGFGGGDRDRRQFDRRDGTGRGHEAMKRGGAGKGNWGAEDGKDEAQSPAKLVEDTPAEEVEVVDAPAPDAEAAAETPTDEAPAEPAAPVVPEKPEMSLEEYEAALAEKKAALNKKNSVAAVDMADFKGMETYKRTATEDEMAAVQTSKRKEEKELKAKVLKEKNLLDTNFKLASADEAPAFGGRGGRGRGGGRGGGGERRGGFGGRGRFGGDAPAPAGADGAAPAAAAPEGASPRGGYGGGGRYGGGGGRGNNSGGGVYRHPRSSAGPAIAIDDTNAFPTLG